MEKVNAFLQREVDQALLMVTVGMDLAVIALEGLKEDIQTGEARGCGDFVLQMDDYIMQVKHLLVHMASANTFMRAMNRSKDENLYSDEKIPEIIWEK